MSAIFAGGPWRGVHVSRQLDSSQTWVIRTGQCPTVQRSYKLLILALVGMMMDIG